MIVIGLRLRVQICILINTNNYNINDNNEITNNIINIINDNNNNNTDNYTINNYIDDNIDDNTSNNINNNNINNNINNTINKIIPIYNMDYKNKGIKKFAVIKTNLKKKLFTLKKLTKEEKNIITDKAFYNLNESIYYFNNILKESKLSGNEIIFVNQEDFDYITKEQKYLIFRRLFLCFTISIIDINNNYTIDSFQLTLPMKYKENRIGKETKNKNKSYNISYDIYYDIAFNYSKETLLLFYEYKIYSIDIERKQITNITKINNLINQNDDLDKYINHRRKIVTKAQSQHGRYKFIILHSHVYLNIINEVIFLMDVTTSKIYVFYWDNVSLECSEEFKIKNIYFLKEFNIFELSYRSLMDFPRDFHWIYGYKCFSESKTISYSIKENNCEDEECIIDNRINW